MTNKQTLQNIAAASANKWKRLHELEAENERLKTYFERIIQVRAGHGMLQGTEALDEMARLAGEALGEQS